MEELSRVALDVKIKDIAYNKHRKSFVVEYPSKICPFLAHKVALEYISYKNLPKADHVLYLVMSGASTSFVNKLRLPVIHMWSSSSQSYAERVSAKYVSLEDNPTRHLEFSIRDKDSTIELPDNFEFACQLVFSSWSQITLILLE